VATPPPGAAELFGTALPLAERYVELLIGPGVERGLIGPAEAGRIWDRHIMNCAALAELVPARCTLADLGSGAGLPGIVLAMLRPGADVTLIEPMARRVAFLTECVTALELDRVRVLRGRAEDLAGEISADIVTARAVAPLGRLAGWAVGICRPGGTVLAVKGAGAQDEVAESAVLLRRLGITDVTVLQVGSDKVDQPATVVKFTAPRRQGRTQLPAGRRPVGRNGDRRLAGRGPSGGSRGSGVSRAPEKRRGDG
jgi:16S rRNA (guanine527-N7)-methyltransferase